MQPVSVSLQNFMSYVDVSIALPTRGIVSLTGINGAGKSAIVEGIAWVLWGKLLRGDSPIADEKKPCIGTIVMDDGMNVMRSRKGRGAATVRVVFPDGTTLDGTTATHAQEQLERVIGSFDSWRRTRVFSSQDAAHFSMATDAERKKLLEGILDLDRFDEALKSCRADWSAASRLFEQSQRNYDVQFAKVDEMKRRLDDAKRGLENFTDAAIVVDAVKAEIARLNEEARANDTLWRLLQEKRSLATIAAAKAQEEAVSSERGLARLQADKCPTCGQVVEVVKGPWREEAKRLRVAANAMKSFAAGVDAKLSMEQEDIRTKQAALNERLSKLKGDIRVQEQQQSARASFQSTVERVERELESSELVLTTTQQASEKHRVVAAKLEACASVLGLRGVRSQVLARALPGIEAAANAWLSRIAGEGVSLSLSSTSELKTGADVEKIGLMLKGLAGGRGYRAASGGQRRRVDVALLLALADIAGAALARAPETLWMDEVFDSLDDDGTEAVAGLLDELSRDHAVVVITHAPGSWLRASKKLRVANGVVEAL